MSESRESFLEPFLDLLTELNLDPFKLEAYLRDPAAVLKDAGLSAAESAALLYRLDNRDRAETTARAAVFIDPGDDPEPNPDPSQPDAVCL
ncbi:hypothetical protein WME76_48195 (plasmid) [Sorangium sp. So ce119]|uniref:hypothetical protein n=1 Tax=Sorangium sp. So ce119 TaxID=3133279 RepID=UPI003F617C42